MIRPRPVILLITPRLHAPRLYDIIYPQRRQIPPIRPRQTQTPAMPSLTHRLQRVPPRTHLSQRPERVRHRRIIKIPTYHHRIWRRTNRLGQLPNLHATQTKRPHDMLIRRLPRAHTLPVHPLRRRHRVYLLLRQPYRRQVAVKQTHLLPAPQRDISSQERRRQIPIHTQHLRVQYILRLQVRQRPHVPIQPVMPIRPYHRLIWRRHLLILQHPLRRRLLYAHYVRTRPQYLRAQRVHPVLREIITRVQKVAHVIAQ